MKTILSLVLLVVALLAVTSVSAVPDTTNFESPAQFTAYGAHLLSERCVVTPNCGEVCVPLFDGSGNSDAQLFRKWLNEKLDECGVDRHMNGLSNIAHLLQPELTLPPGV